MQLDGMQNVVETVKGEGKAPRATQKWASLIEACEMGSESGAAQVLAYLKQRDNLLQAIKDIQHNAEVMCQAEPNPVWIAVDDQCRAVISKVEGK